MTKSVRRQLRELNRAAKNGDAWGEEFERLVARVERLERLLAQIDTVLERVIIAIGQR